MLFFFIVVFPFVVFFQVRRKKKRKKMNGRNMRKDEKNKMKKKTKNDKKENQETMKDKKKETQQRMKNKRGMNKSTLCQQKVFFVLFSDNCFEKRGVVCAPEFLSQTSILSIRPRTFACICCPQFPYYPMQQETHSACFSNRRGAFL